MGAIAARSAPPPVVCWVASKMRTSSPNLHDPTCIHSKHECWLLLRNMMIGGSNSSHGLRREGLRPFPPFSEPKQSGKSGQGGRQVLDVLMRVLNLQGAGETTTKHAKGAKSIGKRSKGIRIPFLLRQGYGGQGRERETDVETLRLPWVKKWISYSHFGRWRREGFEYSTIPALQFVRF